MPDPPARSDWGSVKTVKRVHAVAPIKTAPRQAKSRRSHSNLRQDENDVMPGKGGRDGERGRNGRKQDQRPCDCESGLANGECQRAGGYANEWRTHDANATMERHHAGAHCDKKRGRIYRQREDKPAEQTDAEGVEDKSNGEHGGGSVCKGVTVPPSTTTAAQV
jgi:hypothetical protein